MESAMAVQESLLLTATILAEDAVIQVLSNPTASVKVAKGKALDLSYIAYCFNLVEIITYSFDTTK
jgi:hypothetical protein